MNTDAVFIRIRASEGSESTTTSFSSKSSGGEESDVITPSVGEGEGIGGSGMVTSPRSKFDLMPKKY